MRYILFISLFFSHNLLAETQHKSIPICSALFVSSVKTKAEKMGGYDKFKHCAVSCMLTLRCPASDVLEIGILKELADVFGPGNAEMDDLEADFKGVELVLQKKATSDDVGSTNYDKIYPRHSCK